MTHHLKPSTLLFLEVITVILGPAAPQSRGQTYQVPRTADGKPDLQGIWGVRNTAAYDVEAHSGSTGIPAGLGVIVDPPDGRIPYQPWALAKKKDNFQNRATADQLNKCFLPGVPRLMYLPFPFQIFQLPDTIVITSEYIHNVRNIFMHGKHFDQLYFWNGDSRGHWEGDTLVVDVANFNDESWFDQAGNFHSDALHVVERYTRTEPDVITYEVTIEDPKVFTKSWRMSMPFYLYRDKNFRLLEYECYAYLEGPTATEDQNHNPAHPNK